VKYSETEINGSNLNLFKRFLHNIKQTVKINKLNGNSCVIKYDVPQDRILEPILFILYNIIEIYDASIDGSIVPYADDTCLFFSQSYWMENGVYIMIIPSEVLVSYHIA